MHAILFSNVRQEQPGFRCGRIVDRVSVANEVGSRFFHASKSKFGVGKRNVSVEPSSRESVCHLGKSLRRKGRKVLSRLAKLLESDSITTFVSNQSAQTDDSNISRRRQGIKLEVFPKSHHKFVERNHIGRMTQETSLPELVGVLVFTQVIEDELVKGGLERASEKEGREQKKSNLVENLSEGGSLRRVDVPALSEKLSEERRKLCGKVWTSALVKRTDEERERQVKTEIIPPKPQSLRGLNIA